ncbi:MAG: hypothetical protein GY810_28955 [Aureispira sp.]|nr:hypothetical protein [Aureispira sp.]
MSKLIYLLSILILSFLMPTTGYSSAVPTTANKAYQKLQKKIKKKQLKKRKKRAPHAQNIDGGAVITIVSIVLPIVGLTCGASYAYTWFVDSRSCNFKGAIISIIDSWIVVLD